MDKRLANQHAVEAYLGGYDRIAFTAKIVQLGCNPLGQSQAFVGFAEQKNTGVASVRPAAEIGDHFTSLTPCERDGFCGTNCRGKTACEILSNQLNYKTVTGGLPSFLGNIRFR
ncbi:MAG: hypothetical protein QNJ61_08670 [Desulfobacterales bacterium]|nr:hypothetical protein [Desulfobacterales bacterium]